MRGGISGSKGWEAYHWAYFHRQPLFSPCKGPSELLPYHTAQAYNPTQLNEKSEEELRDRVKAVLCDPADNAGSGLPRFAAFLTYKLLWRLSNINSTYLQEQRCGWAKQAALAKLVANVTGVGIPRDFTGRKDWEAAGNLMDTAIGRWCMKHKKAERAFKAAVSYAVKKGTPAPSSADLEAIEYQIFECARGCTPRGVFVSSTPAGQARNFPILQQPVRWVTDAAQSHHLAQELAEARQQPAQVPILERQLSRVVQGAAVSDRACEKAKQQVQLALASAAWAKAEVARVTSEKNEAAKVAKKAANEKAKESVGALNRLSALGGLWTARLQPLMRKRAGSIHGQSSPRQG